MKQAMQVQNPYGFCTYGCRHIYQNPQELFGEQVPRQFL